MALGRWRGDDSGAFVVVVAIFASALFILGALVVESGVQREARRDAQNAADAAALAAAAVLAKSSGTRSQAVAAAAHYGAANNFPPGSTQLGYFSGCSGPVPSGWQRSSTSSCVSFQPSPSSSGTQWLSVQVVTPTVSTPGLFGSVKSSTRAIAQASIVPGPLVGPPVLFAHSDSCPSPLSWDGSSVNLTGDLHSNGDLAVGGGSITGEGTYRGNVSNRNGATWNPNSGNPVDVSADEIPRDFPQPYDLTDWLPGQKYNSLYPLDYHDAPPGQVIDMTWLSDPAQGYFDPATQVLQPGIYYTDSDIRLTGRIRRTNVTFVSHTGVISFGPGTKGFRPFDSANNKLAAITGHQSATCGEAGVDLTGGRVFWQGVIYAPDSGLHLSNGRLLGVVGGESVEAATITAENSSQITLSSLPATTAAPATVRLLK